MRFAPAKVLLFMSHERDHFSQMLDRHSANVEPDRDAAARECIAEIGEILASGLIRLRARKSSPIVANSGERSLDCVGYQSGHANSKTENGR